ncbi:MAG: putative SAM-dependent methyltransferase [Bacteroidota bacterium]
MDYNIIQLKKGKDAAIVRRHPWVFSGAIQKILGKPEDGDVVEVQTANGHFLALGHWQQGGSISVRLFQFGEFRKIDADFWMQKLESAYNLRQTLNLTQNEVTNAYRLVHGEGDGLPGLIIDIYKNTAVVQAHSIGMHRERHFIANALKQLYGERLQAVYDKSSESLPSDYAKTIKNGYLHGESMATVITENNNLFQVDWETGQKTGFFLDQRDNRALLGNYSVGKRVLNSFCYSGGFSVYALQAGATWVDSVDASARAISWTEDNVKQNVEAANHAAHTSDVLKFLQQTTEPYEVMVLDPPAYAKHLNAKHNAVQGYKRLNALGMKNIVKGGILFTFSCSQVIDRELFYNTIVAAALDAGRSVRVLHHLSQPPDHPVSMFHPEGSYLKGLVLQVE